LDGSLGGGGMGMGDGGIEEREPHFTSFFFPQKNKALL